MDAYERVFSSGNVLKYRTADGWVAHFRSSSSIEPQVEIVDTRKKNPSELAADAVAAVAAAARNDGTAAARGADIEKFALISPRRGGFMSLLHFNSTVRILLSSLARTLGPVVDIRAGRPVVADRAVSAHVPLYLPMIHNTLLALLPRAPATPPMVEIAQRATAPSTADAASASAGAGAGAGEAAGAGAGAGLDAPLVAEEKDTAGGDRKRPLRSSSSSSSSSSSAAANAAPEAAAEPRTRELAAAAAAATAAQAPQAPAESKSHDRNYPHMSRAYMQTKRDFKRYGPYVDPRSADVKDVDAVDVKGESAVAAPGFVLAGEVPPVEEFGADEACLMANVTELAASLLVDDRKGRPEANHFVFLQALHGDRLFERLLCASRNVFFCALQSGATDVASGGEDKDRDGGDEDGLTADDQRAALARRVRRRALRERFTQCVGHVDAAVELWRMLFAIATAPASIGERSIHAAGLAPHFDPYVTKRTMIIELTRHLAATWSHELVNTLPSSTVRSILECMVTAMRCAQDCKSWPLQSAPPPSAAAGAAAAAAAAAGLSTRLRRGNDRAAELLEAANGDASAALASMQEAQARMRAAAVAASAAFRVSESAVRQLAEMGFPEAEVRRAGLPGNASTPLFCLPSRHLKLPPPHPPLSCRYAARPRTTAPTTLHSCPTSCARARSRTPLLLPRPLPAPPAVPPHRARPGR